MLFNSILTGCACVCALQVSFRTSVHRQSFTVEVCVIDKNDNVPTFIGESMRGSVQLGLLKGTRTFSCDVIFVSLATLYSKNSFNITFTTESMPLYPWKLLFTLKVRVANWINYSLITLKKDFSKLSQCFAITWTQTQYSKLN